MDWIVCRVRIEHFVVGVVGVLEGRRRAEARLGVDVGVLARRAGPPVTTLSTTVPAALPALAETGSWRWARSGTPRAGWCLRGRTSRLCAGPAVARESGVVDRVVRRCVGVVVRIRVEVVAVPLDARFGRGERRALVRRLVEQRRVADHLTRHERSQSREKDEEHEDDHDCLARVVSCCSSRRADAVGHQSSDASWQCPGQSLRRGARVGRVARGSVRRGDGVGRLRS